MHGENGGHHELRFRAEAAARKKVLPFMFYEGRMLQSPSEFSTMLRAGRIFQQYLVYQYCKIEAVELPNLR